MPLGNNKINQVNPPFFGDLPDHTLDNILFYLNLPDILQLMCTSSFYKEIIKHKKIVEPWKTYVRGELLLLGEVSNLNHFFSAKFQRKKKIEQLDDDLRYKNQLFKVNLYTLFPLSLLTFGIFAPCFFSFSKEIVKQCERIDKRRGVEFYLHEIELDPSINIVTTHRDQTNRLT